jgi:hypothetical protein
MNPTITFRDVLDNLDKDWDWKFISQNPSITFKDILDKPDSKWDWYYLSENPLITWKNVFDHKEFPWYWEKLSSKPLFPIALQQFKDEISNMVAHYSYRPGGLGYYNTLADFKTRAGDFKFSEQDQYAKKLYMKKYI